MDEVDDRCHQMQRIAQENLEMQEQLANARTEVRRSEFDRIYHDNSYKELINKEIQKSPVAKRENYTPLNRQY